MEDNFWAIRLPKPVQTDDMTLASMKFGKKLIYMLINQEITTVKPHL